MTSFKTILEEAGSLVDGPREKHYGHPAEDFEAVTRAASSLGLFQGPVGVDFRLHHALYMVLVKIQRLVQTPDHHDSVVDIAGYARCYEKILERDENPNPVRELQEDHEVQTSGVPD